MVSKSIVNPFGKVCPLCFVKVSEGFPLVGFGMVLGHENSCEYGKVVRWKLNECSPGCCVSQLSREDCQVRRCRLLSLLVSWRRESSRFVVVDYGVG